MKAGGSEFIWCRINVTPILEDGKPVRMIGIIADITDIKEKTDSLRQAVNMDNFTGLYNKGYTIALINDVLRKKKYLKHALLILDIDNFKSFNDTFGHDEGDKVLQGVSQQLKKTFRKTDIVGRFGGDEFIIFVQDIEDDQWLRDKFRNLLSIQVGGFTCSNSVGVAFFPQDAEVFNELFKKADQALYHAKIQKEKYIFFSEIERL